MERPANPFAEGSVAWSVMEGSLQEEFDGLPGWSDLTPKQIGEVLVPVGDSATKQIRNAMGAIKRRTGYRVRCADDRKRRNGYE